jgi:hypothetical protein
MEAIESELLELCKSEIFTVRFSLLLAFFLTL